MYRVTLRIDRIPPEIGLQAAVDITEGFVSRPWQEKAICSYEDGGLNFKSENDFDDNGLATRDELAHEYSGNVPIFEDDDGNLKVVSVEKF
jgi:hypothetical protein